MAALSSRCRRSMRGHHCNSAGYGFFDLHTILPVVSSLCFAAYGVLTRHTARRDSVETSFFWTGVGGAIGVSLIGPFFGFHLRPQLALDGGSLPNGSLLPFSIDHGL